jgi:hypothetical protein
MSHVKIKIYKTENGIDFDFCRIEVTRENEILKTFENVAYTKIALKNFINKIFDEFGKYSIVKSEIMRASNYNYKDTGK